MYPLHFYHVNSERRHLCSLLSSRPRRRSYLIGKLNYYCNSFACFQLKRHATSGDIHPNPGPTLEHNSRQETKPTRKPKLSYWSLDARSVANKGRELISLLSYKPCDLVAITETWLVQSIESSELFTRSFQVHRQDRTRHGGGILLACSVELGCVRHLDFKTDCEIMWCEINIPSFLLLLLVGVFYRPPPSDAVYLYELQKSLTLIDRSGTNLPLLLLGDFNLPNITWGEVLKCYDALSAVFCDIVDDFSTVNGI